MTVRVYVQSEYLAEVKLVEVDDDATLQDVQHAALGLLPPGTDVSGLSLSLEIEQDGEGGDDDDEDDQDDSKASPPTTPIRDLTKGRSFRVHLHRCKYIQVQVRFSGKTVQRKFAPASTVGRVRRWAGRKLRMAPGDVAEHVLQIAGTTDQPDVDVHIGALARCPACSVMFDLVPAHRING